MVGSAASVGCGLGRVQSEKFAFIFRNLQSGGVVLNAKAPGEQHFTAGNVLRERLVAVLSRTLGDDPLGPADVAGHRSAGHGETALGYVLYDRRECGTGKPEVDDLRHQLLLHPVFQRHGFASMP